MFYIVILESLLALMAILQAGSADVFDDRERNLLVGLRQRGLSDLAEEHCESLLARADLTEKDHALITVERVRNRTANALQGTGANADIDEPVAKFELQHKSNPRLPLVWMQQALAHVALAKQNSLLEKTEKGIQHLRTAKSIFDNSSFAVQQQLQGAVSDEGLDAEQLKTLQTNIQYQLGVADLVLAELYDAQGSRLDKLDSLSNALQQLTEVRKGVANSRQLWWQTWIDELACKRLLKEFDQAQRVLDVLNRKERPPALNAAVLVEEIELGIAKRDAKFLQAIAARDAIDLINNPEAEVAVVKLHVVLGDISRASRQAQRMDRHGAYWSRQADLLLLSVRENPAANATGSAEVLEGERIKLRIATEALNSGNLVDAAAAFESVADTRMAAGNGEQALAAVVQAGQALEKAKQFSKAAQLYLSRSSQAASGKTAPAVHLRGCWALTQVQPADSRFAESLREHVRLWPDSKTANQASGWLAGQLLQQKKADEALEVLLRIDPNSESFSQNLASLRYCLDKAVRQNSNRATAAKLTASLAPIHLKSLGRSKTQLASEMAMIALACDPSLAKEATVRLRSAIENAAGSADPLAMMVLGVAQCTQGGRLEPNADWATWAKSCLAGGLQEADLGRGLQWMQQLSNSDQFGTAESCFAALRLEISRQGLAALPSAKPEMVRRLNLNLAWGLAETGKVDQAVVLFEDLIRSAPKDLGVRRVMAAALGNINAVAEKGLAQWRWVAKRSRPRTDSWFEAKYESARILVRTGKQSDAKKLMEFIKAVPPGWENTKFEDRFENLLLQCR